MDGQEVGGIAELADQLQFVFENTSHLRRHAVGEALSGAGPGQPLEGLLRRLALGDHFARVLVAELVEGKAASFRDRHRRGQRLAVAREQPQHFRRGLQIAVGVAVALEADIVNRGPFADAGDDILQEAPLLVMEEHPVGDDRRDARRPRQLFKLMQPQRVSRPPAKGEGDMGVGPEDRRQLGELPRRGLVGVVGDQDGDQAFGVGGEIGEIQMTRALAGARLAQGEQARQAAVGGSIGGQDDDRDAVA